MIVGAALDLLEDKGLDGVTLRAVASAHRHPRERTGLPRERRVRPRSRPFR